MAARHINPHLATDTTPGKKAYVSTATRRPIARITSGDHEDTMVYISQEDDFHKKFLTPTSFDWTAILSNKRYKKLSNREKSDAIRHLNECLEGKSEPKPEWQDAYDEACAELDARKSLSFDDETLMLAPEISDADRTTVNVSGFSGSGKSTWVCNFGLEYLKAWPDADVFLLSGIAGADESLARLFAKVKRKRRKSVSSDDSDESVVEPGRINLAEAYADGGSLSYSDFPKRSLLIFDDIESIQDKTIREGCYKTLNDCLTMGRHNLLSVVSVSHVAMNFSKTKTILQESQYLCVFPKGTSPNNLERLLVSYGGLDKKQVEQVRSLPSRWVCVRRTFPQAIVYESGVFLTAR